MFEGSNGMQRNPLSATISLIAVNVIIFFISQSYGEAYDHLALRADHFELHQLLTAGFIHGTLSHLIFNMWGLYIFGMLVAPRIGQARYYATFLAGVLIGNAIFLICSWGTQTYLVGSSGGVCAMMMAAAMLEPDRRFVMIFLPGRPIKTTTLVICYAVLEILFEITGTEIGISHLAHLGGFVGGYMVIRLACASAIAWDPIKSLGQRAPDQGNVIGGLSSKKVKTGMSQEELARILIKLSQTGINSLTKEEYEKLRRFHEQNKR